MIHFIIIHRHIYLLVHLVTDNFLSVAHISGSRRFIWETPNDAYHQND